MFLKKLFQESPSTQQQVPHNAAVTTAAATKKISPQPLQQQSIFTKPTNYSTEAFIRHFWNLNT